MQIDTRKLLKVRIKEYLTEMGLKYETAYRIPEKRIKADFFIYSTTPTIIQCFHMHHLTFRQSDRLIPRILPFKLVNGGHIRFICIFYYTNEFKKKEESTQNFLYEKIIDTNICIPMIKIQVEEEFQFSEETKNELNYAMKKPYKITNFIKELEELEKKSISKNRIAYVISNFDKSSIFYNIMLSFYFFHFDKSRKKELKEQFSIQLEKMKERFKSIEHYKDMKSGEFERRFEVKGWDFENEEIKAIIYQARDRLKRISLVREKNLMESFDAKFVEEAELIRENLLDPYKDKWNKIVEEKHHKNLGRNFSSILLNFCLQNSDFKFFNSVKTIRKGGITFFGYLEVKNEDKIFIFRNFLPSDRVSITAQIGKILRVLYKGEDIELFLFYSVYDVRYENIKYAYSKFSMLEESGWKVFPFQGSEDNIAILNQLLLGEKEFEQ